MISSEALRRHRARCSRRRPISRRVSSRRRSADAIILSTALLIDHIDEQSGRLLFALGGGNWDVFGLLVRRNCGLHFKTSHHQVAPKVNERFREPRPFGSFSSLRAPSRLKVISMPSARKKAFARRSRPAILGQSALRQKAAPSRPRSARHAEGLAPFPSTSCDLS